MAVAIGVVAIALRCWRLSWGLPSGPGYLGFPDEALMWGAYVKDFIPLSWSSFDQENLIYPTLYGELVGLTSAAMHALGFIGTQPPAANTFRVTPQAILLARSISVTMSLATVAVVGFAGSRMYSRRVGLFAAAFMAVVPFEATYSHVASPDFLLTTCSTLTIVLAFLVVTRDGAWRAVAAGVAAGAATGTKYTGLAMTVPVAWAAAETALGRRSIRTGVVVASLSLLGFALAVVLACPSCVLHSDRMLVAMQNHLRVNTDLYIHLHNNFLTPSLGWYGRPYAYQLVASLPYVFGFPMYALALSGVCIALWRREIADRVILAGIVPYFLSMSASMVVYPRYLLPILPGLVILAARGLSGIRNTHFRNIIFALVWAYSFALVFSQVSRLSFDQQDEVAQWIVEDARRTGDRARAVTVGSPKMMLDYFRLATPLSAKGLTYIQLADGNWFHDPPEFFVLPEWYEIAIERDMPSSKVAEDLLRLRSGLAGYCRAASWSSTYLHRDLYTSLDPAFAADLWQGEIGFTVYTRGTCASRDSRNVIQGE